MITLVLVGLTALVGYRIGYLSGYRNGPVHLVSVEEPPVPLVCGGSMETSARPIIIEGSE